MLIRRNARGRRISIISIPVKRDADPPGEEGAELIAIGRYRHVTADLYGEIAALLYEEGRVEHVRGANWQGYQRSNTKFSSILIRCRLSQYRAVLAQRQHTVVEDVGAR